MSDERFIEDAYRLILRRAPDAEGRAAALDALASGRQSRAALMRGLVASPEFERVALLEDAIARARRGPLRGLHAPPGTDERAIEIPWVLSRYAGERRVLDVGYAHAPAPYLDAIAGLGAEQLVGVDLVERDVAGLRSTVADLRALPFADEGFDVGFCISTLEHVGCDNTVYGQAAEHDERGMQRALAELRRTCGRLLITVPTGLREDHRWFVQRPAGEWLALFEEAGFAVAERETYELGPGGWGSVTGEPPVRYGERGPAASAVLCAELRAPRPRAAPSG
jgi:hypothetical protein